MSSSIVWAGEVDFRPAESACGEVPCECGQLTRAANASLLANNQECLSQDGNAIFPRVT